MRALHVPNANAEDLPPTETETPAAEFAARREALRAALGAERVDAALIADPRDLLYFCGVICGGALILPVEGEPTLVAHRVASRLGSRVPFEVRALRSRADVRDALGPRALGRVGIVLSRLSASKCAQFSDAAGSAAVIDVSWLVDGLRMRKSDWEIAQVRCAAQQAHEALSLAGRLLADGASDLETQLAVETWLRGSGHPGLSHGAASDGASVVVLAGPDASIPAYFNSPLGGPGLRESAPTGPRGRIPAGDEPIVVDLIGHHAGYFADQTRTLVKGGLPPALEQALAVCDDALSSMEGTLRGGARIGDVHRAATDVVETNGFMNHWMGNGEAAVPFVGHGIGLAISEPPYIVEGSDVPLQPGTIIALEPKLIIDGVGAVGVEHTYLVQADGAERLTVAASAGSVLEFGRPR